ncbi:1-deoxyxylulose-5-phosphate synthase, thiamine-requiring, FAD-requiring [Candidatus Desulfarcum epimagneticum]|uniref:1-deoxy-D-xylulose-5-phosphate synthase n=1 Tax=uncultured Desulfobacteraceae bacterium TaxID=218296 RepID=A0A484HGV9_9BACT|nr:1-deoxyxylulose-5-phosphate synthase, thiamine-requiring, FAD-requiring [uncultured Desulfobacteraceae bacterium]
MSLLKTIHSPKDLKALSEKELPLLAEEIRDVIIHVVSKNGGHLASSLGAVELAIAIHYVFDTPNDRIVWDVGHQTYAHKILTGRKDRFDTIRTFGGLSGFTRMSESPYDAFSTGHSSTSISAGLGMAVADSLNGSDSRTVAVIGDGSMTAGMAYEALNQAGDIHQDKPFTVILNDNEMSIAHNVGALSSILSRAFSKKSLQSLKKNMGDLLKSVPKIGDDIYQMVKRSEDAFKTFVTPGMIFQAFNFDYFGPVKGHNLKRLIEILKNIKDLDRPVLLHVLTKKGKGYPPSEKNPVYYHGVGCFDVETGNSLCPKDEPPSYTDVFGKTLSEMAEKDRRIVALTAAMPEGTGLSEFAETHPDRFFDVGIAEQHCVTFAAGMAARGLKPVVAIYSTFLQRSYDQILHDVCLEGLGVVFALDRGGIVGEDGPTHHGLFDISYLRTLPNMVLMAPKDENELRRMMAAALAHDGPVAIRYPRGPGIGVPLDESPSPVPMGKGEILKEGDDLLILAIGHMVPAAVAAWEVLLKQGVSVTVVNCRFVKPLDSRLIGALAEKIPRVMTVEEHMIHGGFGSAVLEFLAHEGIRPRAFTALGIRDVFVEHGSQSVLRAKYGLDTDGIANAAMRLMKK